MILRRRKKEILLKFGHSSNYVKLVDTCSIFLFICASLEFLSDVQKAIFWQSVSTHDLRQNTSTAHFTDITYNITHKLCDILNTLHLKRNLLTICVRTPSLRREKFKDSIPLMTWCVLDNSMQQWCIAAWALSIGLWIWHFLNLVHDGSASLHSFQHNKTKLG